jgi:ABC-type uncharacterized transport system ATPase subunit
MRNKLFTFALGAAFALGFSGAALAQDNAAPPQEQDHSTRGAHPMDPDRMLQRLTRELDLTADQQSQIKPLLVDHQQKVEALVQDQSVSQQDRHAKMKTLSEDMHSKIAAVLTDQQKQKFESMLQRTHRGGENSPPPPPQP